MFENLKDWFDHRTGYKKLIEVMLIEDIPGGAKWRYVWGSCLAFIFSIQLVTGILLMSAYSPSESTAWASVHFIQYEMDFGWFLRGLHHYGSQVMVVLLAVHMLQVVIAGAHLPPREVNWWLGLALMGAVLGMSLTGYLLPWDQKGFWATQVSTNIAGNLPILGSFLQKIIVGGPSYGHHTLTRFFALHVAVFPGLIILLLIAHIAVFRRHGVTHSRRAEGEGWFWPDQAFKDLLASMIIFGILVGLVVFGGPQFLGIHPANPIEVGAPVDGQAERGLWDRVAHAGRDGYGVNLDAPADPSSSYPARPEWYFLFLFQLLKYFEGNREIVGTVVIPGLVAAVLFVLPLLGYGRMRLFGHFAGFVIVVSLIGGAGTLTYLAISEDIAESKKGRDYRKQREEATKMAARAVQLASKGIPADGAVNLLRRDPKTQGPKLFEKHCASCHNHGTEFTTGTKASDLEGFGTEEWIYGLLADAGSEKYFGHTDLSTMADWTDNIDWQAMIEEEGEGRVKDQLKLVAKFLATHPLPQSKEEKNQEYATAMDLLGEKFGCFECHGFEEELEGAPNLAGYGSQEWIRGMIMSPDHPLRYGEENAMPIFLDLDGLDAEVIRQETAEQGRSPPSNLSAVDRELIIRWLTRDFRLVIGGESIR